MEILLFKRKEGFILNNNDKILNNIIKAIYRNDGNCPCQLELHKCPCNEYLIKSNCHCKLYIKDTLPEVQGIEKQ